MKADDKVQYEDGGEKMKFTYFEEVAAQVDVLIDTIDKHATILRDNNLRLVTEEDAPEFNEDEVYKKLEED